MYVCKSLYVLLFLIVLVNTIYTFSFVLNTWPYTICLNLPVQICIHLWIRPHPPCFFHDWHDCGVLYWFCWILTHCAGVQVDECRVQRHPGLDLFEAQHLPDASLSADQEQHAQTVTTEIVCAHFRKILIATVISVSRRAGYIRCRTSATSSRRATCASHCCRWPSASTWIASTSASLPAPYVRTNRVPIGAAE